MAIEARGIWVADIFYSYLIGVSFNYRTRWKTDFGFRLKESFYLYLSHLKSEFFLQLEVLKHIKVMNLTKQISF